MATWHVGPFDNDDAVDWCASLDSAPEEERSAVAREALDAALREGATAADAARAVAAAATVLYSLTGVLGSNSPYAPRLLIGGSGIEVDRALWVLAGKVLDMVLTEGSGWRLQWAEDVEEEEALAVVEDLRAGLAMAP